VAIDNEASADFKRCIGDCASNGPEFISYLMNSCMGFLSMVFFGALAAFALIFLYNRLIAKNPDAYLPDEQSVDTRAKGGGSWNSASDA